MFYSLRKARAEAEIARRKAQQDKLALQTKALAQVIMIYANAAKQREGTNTLEFSDTELGHALGTDRPRVHAVMDLLKLEGKARKSDVPGYWFIE